MLYGLYISAAGLQSQEYRQNVMANNLANAQTHGFKRDLAQAQARLNPALESSEFSQTDSVYKQAPSGGVWSLPTGIDLTQAMLEKTSNPRDVALSGSGFFMVQGQNKGETLLTRNGQLAVDDEGYVIQASSGFKMLDTQQKPIKIDPNKPMDISTKGEIKQDGATVGQMGVVSVNSAADLEKRGSNLMALKSGSSLQPTTTATQVKQGMLETSGVDPMVEMVAMLEGQRHFEANTKMIQYQDQSLQMLNTVGKVG